VARGGGGEDTIWTTLDNFEMRRNIEGYPVSRYVFLLSPPCGRKFYDDLLP
jgi:hypothetical protein